MEEQDDAKQHDDLPDHRIQEDLLERLVGEIADEHDGEEYPPIVEDDAGWVVDGRLPLADLEAAMGRSLTGELP